MDQDLAQVTVATLADPRQPRLAAGRVLLRQQSHPGCELSSLRRHFKKGEFMYANNRRTKNPNIFQASVFQKIAYL